jgi:hypothetical protein
MLKHSFGRLINDHLLIAKALVETIDVPQAGPMSVRHQIAVQALDKALGEALYWTQHIADAGE